jgi:hypothetical protein
LYSGFYDNCASKETYTYENYAYVKIDISCIIYFVLFPLIVLLGKKIFNFSQQKVIGGKARRKETTGKTKT